MQSFAETIRRFHKLGQKSAGICRPKMSHKIYWYLVQIAAIVSITTATLTPTICSSRACAQSPWMPSCRECVRIGLDFATELGLDNKHESSVDYAEYLIAQMKKLYDNRQAEFGRAICSVNERFNSLLSDMLNIETNRNDMPLPASQSLQRLFQSSGIGFDQAAASIRDTDFIDGLKLPHMEMCPCPISSAPLYETQFLKSPIDDNRRRGNFYTNAHREQLGRRSSLPEMPEMPELPPMPEMPAMPPMPFIPPMPDMPPKSEVPSMTDIAQIITTTQIPGILEMTITTESPTNSGYPIINKIIELIDTLKGRPDADNMYEINE